MLLRKSHIFVFALFARLAEFGCKILNCVQLAIIMSITCNPDFRSLLSVQRPFDDRVSQIYFHFFTELGFSDYLRAIPRVLGRRRRNRGTSKMLSFYDIFLQHASLKKFWFIWLFHRIEIKSYIKETTRNYIKSLPIRSYFFESQAKTAILDKIYKNNVKFYNFKLTTPLSPRYNVDLIFFSSRMSYVF